MLLNLSSVRRDMHAEHDSTGRRPLLSLIRYGKEEDGCKPSFVQSLAKSISFLPGKPSGLQLPFVLKSFYEYFDGLHASHEATGSTVHKMLIRKKWLPFTNLMHQRQRTAQVDAMEGSGRACRHSTRVMRLLVERYSSL